MKTSRRQALEKHISGKTGKKARKGSGAVWVHPLLFCFVNSWKTVKSML